jgi:hypothetical protein
MAAENHLTSVENANRLLSSETKFQINELIRRASERGYSSIQFMVEVKTPDRPHYPTQINYEVASGLDVFISEVVGFPPDLCLFQTYALSQQFKAQLKRKLYKEIGKREVVTLTLQW